VCGLKRDEWGESPCNAKSFGTEHFKQIDVEQAKRENKENQGKKRGKAAREKRAQSRERCSDVEITIWLET